MRAADSRHRSLWQEHARRAAGGLTTLSIDPSVPYPPTPVRNRGYTIFVRIDPRVAGPLNRGRRGKASVKGEGNESMTKTGNRRAHLGRTVATVSTCGLLSSACATVPTGPGVMALPGIGESFEQFQIDDTVCRQRNGAGTGR